MGFVSWACSILASWWVISFLRSSQYKNFLYWFLFIYLLRTCFHLGYLFLAHWVSWWSCFSWASVLSLPSRSNLCETHKKVSIWLESAWISLPISHGLYSPLSYFERDQSMCWSLSCVRFYIWWWEL